MDHSFHNETTFLARFRRELRNPSMLTVFLIVISFLVIVLAPFAPKWVITTQDSLEAISEQKKIDQQSMGSFTAIVPSQIAPWMAQQASTMSSATGPLEWKVVSFRTGPCDLENLSQLPDGKYSDAIVEVCGELDRIQQHYSGNCFLATDCNVPAIAKEEIEIAMQIVWDAFSDAGFVLPYTEWEQVLP
ncbi:MAG: hypothetical protein EGP07_02840 [SAR202 cluster bacterium]|jgi:hypothetical protein|nr:MAG: hypothetical protein EGP11_06000 [SAR202 cluster bacterium]GIT58086.1 MAG: hypothetical protein Ct9H300mP19_00340 [Dehalococcoidia bacterium]KAA1301103.1 MAG: hypothetical protein EGP07_02840 [SAR202 cluster bacterium]KAA1301726.1 MAG: hypothetical protein EGP04_06555 [SAR202 cluster bacterium]MQG36869.1 hypothetical protein [SAR202 cluster bacterium]|tara:strand:- start:2911 stop:3477 length:567 start_codon:yes stop_codon:yes gene_type:complete